MSDENHKKQLTEEQLPKILEDINKDIFRNALKEKKVIEFATCGIDMTTLEGKAKASVCLMS